VRGYEGARLVSLAEIVGISTEAGKGILVPSHSRTNVPSNIKDV